MSFLTGTNQECIYASTAVGATLATFTSEAQLNTTATMGTQAHLPPDFWLPNKAQVGRGIRIVVRGIVSSTATPTFQVYVRCGANTGPNTTSAILLGTAAITTGSGVSNQYWEMQGDVIVTSMGAAGTNTQFQGVGYMIGLGATPFIYPAYAAPGASTPASPGTVTSGTQLDTSVTNYINVNAICGTSSASNSITLNQLLVFGLN